MGITIHFEGKLNNQESYDALIKKAIEFSKFQDWEYFQLKNEFKTLERVINEEIKEYDGPTKGIQIHPHENSEPLILEFDKDLYIQEYCKTQFAPIEIHIKVIELLNILKQYFENLNAFDEGEYLETNDLNILEENWKDFYIAMNKTIEENNTLQGPFKLENGRIIDLM